MISGSTIRLEKLHLLPKKLGDVTLQCGNGIVTCISIQQLFRHWFYSDILISFQDNNKNLFSGVNFMGGFPPPRNGIPPIKKIRATYFLMYYNILQY